MAFRVSGADIYVSFNAEAPDAIVGVAPIAVLLALVVRHDARWMSPSASGGRATRVRVGDEFARARSWVACVPAANSELTHRG